MYIVKKIACTCVNRLSAHEKRGKNDNDMMERIIN